ncbi:MAG: hypothetical protein WBF77_12090 [Sulfurimonadaceae bacterium]
MKYLQLSLLSFSLAAFMLGCGTESDEAPLVPEIISISIDDANVTTPIRSLVQEVQLGATVLYSDGTSSNATYQLDWESNDTSVVVNNGLVVAAANHGTATISASYRDKLYTTESKTIEITPLTELNITTTSADLNITYNDTNASQAAVDINVTGSYTLQANGTFEDNETVLAISSNIAWTSSNTTVATIDSAGLMTIYSLIDQNGTADINVSIYNEVNATLELNVSL